MAGGEKMKDVIMMALILIYVFSVICLSCYMAINYGWYWIFLLLFCCISYTHENKDGG